MNILFNGRGFNCERAVTKTETEFVGLHLRTGFLPELKLADRFLLLKEAYALCLKALGKETPAETTEQTPPEENAEDTLKDLEIEAPKQRTPRKPTKK